MKDDIFKHKDAKPLRGHKDHNGIKKLCDLWHFFVAFVLNVVFTLCDFYKRNNALFLLMYKVGDIGK